MARASRIRIVVLLLCTAAWAAPSGLRAASGGGVAFAVIGDFGTGSPQQYELARIMDQTRLRVPYTFVLTVGDNIYGGWSRRAIVEKFETPYQRLLDAGVSFFASLGNHDDSTERDYPLFNMGGQRYYSVRRDNVEFFALDSNYMDGSQLAWIADVLRLSDAPWKIAFFHHPLYSSAGRHGSERDLRTLLEPLFVEHGVQVVFSGHDHVYERVKAQRGVTYFVCGSSGQVRRGNLTPQSPLTAVGFDQDQAFVVVTVLEDVLRFETVSRAGAIVDAGEIRRVPAHETASTSLQR
jgi:hypothetical protein